MYETNFLPAWPFRLVAKLLILPSNLEPLYKRASFNVPTKFYIFEFVCPYESLDNFQHMATLFRCDMHSQCKTGRFNSDIDETDCFKECPVDALEQSRSHCCFDVCTKPPCTSPNKCLITKGKIEHMSWVEADTFCKSNNQTLFTFRIIGIKPCH